MAIVIETVSYYHFGSINFRCDGKALNGKKQHFYRDCKESSRKNLTPRAYCAEFQAQALAAYHERCSQLGVCRTFGIAKQTLTDWLKRAATLPPLKTTLTKAQKGEPLELDELWSLVRQKRNKRRVWLAQCRRTSQIVTYAIGDRSETTCTLLRSRIPKAYKTVFLYTDFWSAYALVL